MHVYESSCQCIPESELIFDGNPAKDKRAATTEYVRWHGGRVLQYGAPEWFRVFGVVSILQPRACRGTMGGKSSIKYSSLSNVGATVSARGDPNVPLIFYADEYNTNQSGNQARTCRLSSWLAAATSR
jgi:hypothetical protein